MSLNERIEAIVSGRVQGVSFRSFTVSKASELGLKGYVKNLPDRTVEVVAEGSKEKINELISWLRKGPLLSKINEVKISCSEVLNEFSDFRIKY